MFTLQQYPQDDNRVLICSSMHSYQRNTPPMFIEGHLCIKNEDTFMLDQSLEC